MSHFKKRPRPEVKKAAEPFVPLPPGPKLIVFVDGHKKYIASNTFDIGLSPDPNGRLVVRAEDGVEVYRLNDGTLVLKKKGAPDRSNQVLAPGALLVRTDSIVTVPKYLAGPSAHEQALEVECAAQKHELDALLESHHDLKVRLEAAQLSIARLEGEIRGLRTQETPKRPAYDPKALTVVVTRVVGTTTSEGEALIAAKVRTMRDLLELSDEKFKELVNVLTPGTQKELNDELVKRNLYRGMALPPKRTPAKKAVKPEPAPAKAKKAAPAKKGGKKK